MEMERRAGGDGQIKTDGRPPGGEHMVSLFLRWIRLIRCTQQLLDADQNLLDGDARSPPRFLVQDRQAHFARGEHVRVEEVAIEPRNGGLGGVVLGEFEGHRVVGTGPVGALLAGDGTAPQEEVLDVVGI